MIDGVYLYKFRDSVVCINIRINNKTSLYWVDLSEALQDNIMYDIPSEQKDLKIPMEFIRGTN